MTNESDCTTSATDYQQHWDAAYAKNPAEKLGWYEPKSEEILKLIQKTTLSHNAKILNVGIGSSTLIDDLLATNFSNIIANDLSSEALSSLKKRLGEASKKVEFIQDDLTNPTELHKLTSVDLWIDRAVLHFFLTVAEQQSYFNLLKKLVQPNGFVIIAVFALNGAEKCCGLQLQRYNKEMLQEKLGDDFQLVDSFDHTFINPYGGERPYVYTLFKRKQ
ncbi:class I SAM-dependent methyltransferase [Tenacibaculum sp. IB213877]|uniref:class I SAM-dependent methyltransferase n=1 Tax=Tenacibaculum sp. IB213877 TaxID=3097351 RepID=UPI002A599892|nr:class I SAM-dependent methyltransferase [Tenacibaculum sp. IB213877]MDY0781473.1 class I SAM-dependent methyltransferase [Tenacibaculum sp. IB213877]